VCLFSNEWGRPAGIITLVKKGQKKVEAWKASNDIQKSDRFALTGDMRRYAEKMLYQDDGKELLSRFQNQYEDQFQVLVEDNKKINSKFVVLYIPYDNYTNPSNVLRRKVVRKYYSDLAAKYQVDFLDMTDEFLKYPVDLVTLLPENGHLSRFGHRLVANKLSKYLEEHQNYRSDFRFKSRPNALSDLKPKDRSIQEALENFPYRAVINSQGLRMDYDLPFPKEKQRVLVMGSSITYGQFVPNSHTYAVILDKQSQEREAAYASVVGYAIPDQVLLFTERAKYIEPDITVLELHPQGLFMLFYYVRNELNRNGEVYLPSPLETKFLSQALLR